MDADVPVRLVADGGRIGQVLSNLLTNAVKFTPDNGVIRLRVLHAPALPGVAGFTIWNSGAGIPEADLERIFEQRRAVRSAVLLVQKEYAERLAAAAGTPRTAR